uniref:Uncharacterized protein n=1 Tax=Graphocephala atropunctata TaxID=36148 RepID=A0A1B6KP29_9HEMI
MCERRIEGRAAEIKRELERNRQQLYCSLREKAQLEASGSQQEEEECEWAPRVPQQMVCEDVPGTEPTVFDILEAQAQSWEPTMMDAFCPTAASGPAQDTGMLDDVECPWAPRNRCPPAPVDDVPVGNLIDIYPTPTCPQAQPAQPVCEFDRIPEEERVAFQQQFSEREGDADSDESLGCMQEMENVDLLEGFTTPAQKYLKGVLEKMDEPLYPADRLINRRRSRAMGYENLDYLEALRSRKHQALYEETVAAAATAIAADGAGFIVKPPGREIQRGLRIYQLLPERDRNLIDIRVTRSRPRLAARAAASVAAALARIAAARGGPPAEGETAAATPPPACEREAEVPPACEAVAQMPPACEAVAQMPIACEAVAQTTAASCAPEMTITSPDFETGLPPGPSRQTYQAGFLRPPGANLPRPQVRTGSIRPPQRGATGRGSAIARPQGQLGAYRPPPGCETATTSRGGAIARPARGGAIARPARGGAIARPRGFLRAPSGRGRAAMPTAADIDAELAAGNVAPQQQTTLRRPAEQRTSRLSQLARPKSRC